MQPSPDASPATRAPLTEAPRRWHVRHFLLAALVLLTTGLVLFLSHTITDSYRGAVVVNQAWATRQGLYAELGQLAAAVSRQRNERVALGDVIADAQRLSTALAGFRAKFEEASTDLNRHPNLVEASSLRERLRDVEMAMGRIVADTSAAAGQRTATRDHGDADLEGAFARLDREVRTLYRARLDQQLGEANRLRRLEALVAVLAVLMFAGALHHRRRLMGRMQRAALEREGYARDLKAARQRVEAASAAKTQFLSSMSHEIRTPMNGVLGMTELLLSTSLDHEQRRFATSALKSAQNLLAVINNVLDFSKIEAGEPKLDAVSFDARDLLELRLTSPSTSDLRPANSPDQAARSARLLLAEDNEISQELTQRMLEALGYHVDVVADGEAALRAAHAVDYDLILMDCHMPTLDGYAATQRWREHERSVGGRRRTPIIALTANAMADDREQCLRAGMDAHLAKPFTRAQLAQTISEWTARAAA